MTNIISKTFMALIICGLLLITNEPVVLAQDGAWPKSPSDQEIDEAIARFIQKEAVDKPITDCSQISDYIEKQLCLAGHSYRFTLSDEDIYKREVIETYVIKMHHPSVSDPLLGNAVVLLYTTKNWIVNKDGRKYELLRYETAILEYGTEQGQGEPHWRFNPAAWWEYDHTHLDQSLPPRALRDAKVELLFRKQDPRGYYGWEIGFMESQSKPDISKAWIKRVPLCQEARNFFTESYLEKAGFKTAEDMEETSLLMDEQDLFMEFQDAIDRYNETPGKEAYAGPNVFGSIPASSWLASEAGLVDEINRQFVYYKGKKDWGTEPALRDAIINFYNQNNSRKLTPGDVFYLALQQKEGDAKAALLLAHNTLRTLSRPDTSASDPHYLEKLVGLEYDKSFADQYLAPTRSEDSSGPWYHMFGTAYYSMETEGDYGPAAVLMYMNPVVGTQAYALKNGLELIMQKTGIKSTNQEFWSQVANWFEQYIRWRKNSVPDPEKFCVNVWGAKIGVALYNSLPSANAKTPLGYTTTTTIFGPITLPDAHILVDGSPVVLTVEGNGYKMVVDQGAGNIYGYYPIMLLPFLEQDGTWGMGWMNRDDRLYKITFEAVADGTLHFADLDTELQQLAYYETPIQVGDTYSLIFDASLPPTPLVAPDGSVIEPVISAVDTSAITKLMGEDQDISTDIGSLPSEGEINQIHGDYQNSDQDSILPWVAAAGGFFAVVAGAFILKARKPTPAAQKPPAARHTDTSRRPGLGASSGAKKVDSLSATRQKSDRHPSASSTAECPKCGAAISPTSRFCPSCGAEIKSTQDKHVCPSCGQPVRAGAAFCRNCGQKLK